MDRKKRLTGSVWKTAKAAAKWMKMCDNSPADIILENIADFGPHDRVLDFGCGNGRNAVPVLRRGAQVTLADVNPYLLEDAQQAARKTGGAFEAVKIEERPSFPNDYTRIILIGVLHACPDKAEILRGCYEWLKYGGRLYSSSLGESLDCKSPYRFGSFRDFLAAHMACGFRQIVGKESWNGRSVIYDGIFEKR